MIMLKNHKEEVYPLQLNLYYNGKEKVPYYYELYNLMGDLRSTGCDILTIGQYLRPTADHLPVVRYYAPEEFMLLKKTALDMGFLWVAPSFTVSRTACT